MSKDAFDKIADGLNEALVTTRGQGKVMESMVEKVAQAIEDAVLKETYPKWEKDGDFIFCIDSNTGFRPVDVAKAAIEAMREPTDRMLEAGNIPGWDDSVTVGLSGEIWPAMIDAALNDPA